MADQESLALHDWQEKGQIIMPDMELQQLNELIAFIFTQIFCYCAKKYFHTNS